MHSLPFIAASSPAQLPPIEMMRPVEKEKLPETKPEGKSFNDYLDAKDTNAVRQTTERNETRTEKKNDISLNDDIKNRESADKETASAAGLSAHKDISDKETPAEKKSLHLSIPALHLPHFSAKKPAAQGDTVKTEHAEKAESKKKKTVTDLAQIEQGIASILATLTAHKEMKTAKADSLKEGSLPLQTKDILLQKTTLARKQTASMEQQTAPADDKLIAKKADQFLARLEQMFRKNSPKDFKQEHLAAISDDMKKTIAEIRQAAVKHTKPHASDAAVTVAVKNDAARTETVPATESAAKDSGSALLAVAPSAAAKSDGDTSSSFSFMKQSQGFKDISLSAKDSPASALRGTSFSDHVDEIISKSRLTVRDGQNGTMAFRLNPDSLGSVNVNIGLENGVLSAKFLVDSEEAKQTLGADLNALKATLAQEGIELGQFQVDVRAGNSGSSGDADKTPHHAFRTVSEEEKISRDYDNASIPSHNGMIDMKI